uniref:uncharacterized protein LOC101302505 isoform X3 n=1 Tax=Fragaria vesca subsp. vesca TaxID=101020 RepID=UPI0005C9133E|nr:PREDICTED: uncharacterized protein LOC101302505 isoform X3 [Fragaria vesca subsp. vesca]
MERQRRWGNAVVIRRRSARFRSRVVGSCRFFKISGKTSGFYSRNSHDQISSNPINIPQGYSSGFTGAACSSNSPTTAPFSKSTCADYKACAP